MHLCFLDSTKSVCYHFCAPSFWQFSSNCRCVAQHKHTNIIFYAHYPTSSRTHRESCSRCCFLDSTKSVCDHFCAPSFRNMRVMRFDTRKTRKSYSEHSFAGSVAFRLPMFALTKMTIMDLKKPANPAAAELATAMKSVSAMPLLVLELFSCWSIYAWLIGSLVYKLIRSPKTGAHAQRTAHLVHGRGQLCRERMQRSGRVLLPLGKKNIYI